MPAFGFSAGDFISAIELIAKVSTALRDSGGASRVITELESLRTIFEKLRTNELPPLGIIGGSYGSVKAHATCTLEMFSDFLLVISKFDSKLQSSAPKGWYHGSRRKVQWAVTYAKEVEKLRVAIGTQLQTLNRPFN